VKPLYVTPRRAELIKALDKGATVVVTMTAKNEHLDVLLNGVVLSFKQAFLRRNLRIFCKYGLLIGNNDGLVVGLHQTYRGSNVQS
jgi:hypothetical protein